MELYQYYGNDIQLTTNLQLQLVDGELETQQRILRRLLTATNNYVWHTDYGAGLPAYIGQNLSLALEKQLIGTIRKQMFLEDTVQQNPPPKIAFSQSGTTLTVSITYVSKASGSVYTLSFTVGA
jgi:hypothetical protein